jgi:phosphoesterase RecJ-like protein
LALQEVKKALTGSHKVFLTTHVRPDGDALGALIALAFILRKLGKEVIVAIGEKSEVPSHYSFLPGVNEIEWAASCSWENFDLAVALDAASAFRLGTYQSFFEEAPILTVNIDHHVSNDSYARINWVDDGFSSTSEMVYCLAVELGVELEKDTALNLYVGILTDTGRFQYPNTSPQTLEVAKDLLNYGIVPFQVYAQVYEGYSYAAFKLLGEIMARSQLTDGILYTYIEQEDLKNYGLKMPDTEDYVDFLRSVKEAKLVVLFKHLSDEEVRVSLRSRQLPSHLIAKEFGGGGHPGAAGFITKLSRQEVLNKIKELLEEGF